MRGQLGLLGVRLLEDVGSQERATNPINVLHISFRRAQVRPADLVITEGFPCERLPFVLEDATGGTLELTTTNVEQSPRSSLQRIDGVV